MTGLPRAPFGGGLLFDAAGRLRSAGAATLLGQEYSSARLASLASRALDNPFSLTLDEIRSLGGSVLTQAPPRTGLLGTGYSGRYAGAASLLGVERSSAELASLASRAMQDPVSLSGSEIKSLGGSVLTQAPNR